MAQTGLLASVALTALRAPPPRRPDRGAWIALTVALAAWSFGNIAYWRCCYAGGEPPDGASLADAGWLAFYPAAYLCIGLHLRARVRGLPAEHVARRPRRRARARGRRHRAVRRADPRRPRQATAPQVVLNGGLPDRRPAAGRDRGRRSSGSTRGRRARSWLLLAAGLRLLRRRGLDLPASASPPATTAATPARRPVARGLRRDGARRLAAAERARALSVLGGWRTLAVSSVACLASVALLVAAGLTHVPAVAVCLAGAALLAAMARTGLTLRELRLFAETRRQATTDELTGLPNRRWFDRRLTEAIAEARLTGRSLALMVIDLDHFKELNDTLGHHAGDRVLAQLGPRIRAELRASDDVARLGGDEFAVLLDGRRATPSAPASGSPRRSATASPSRASSCRSPPASASPASPSTATTPRRCSSAPTSRCTRPRPAARAPRSTRASATATPASACS